MPAIRLALLAGALAMAAPAATATSCQPPAATSGQHTPAPAGHDVSGEGESAVEFSASCDESDVAFNVEPDTAAARAEANRVCAASGEAIDNAPWPEGMHPINLGDVQH